MLKKKSRKHTHKENEVAALGEEKGGREKAALFFFSFVEIFFLNSKHVRKGFKSMLGKRRSTNTPNYNQRQHLPAPLPPPLLSVPSVKPRVPLPETGSELYVSR